MATVKPFAALRPRPDLAHCVGELPYDVMSSDEARQVAAGNPLSFLRVSKPEIDLPAGTDPYAPQVYAQGAETFRRWIADGVLRPEARPCFYLYRQVMDRHSQTGFVGVASCQDYLDQVIRKHELTRPDKEDDRVRHLEALNAQTGPAFLLYRATSALDSVLARRTATAPDLDFTAADGVRHVCWTLADAATVAEVEEGFRRIPVLYIADGHHRTAAAGRVFQSRGGAGGSRHFLSVLFPHEQVCILPYHRVVKDLNGLTAETLLQRLQAVFVMREPGEANPGRPHDLGLYLGGRWRTLTFKPELTDTRDPIGHLDVTLLQEHVLTPILGIDDPRRSQRIQFVGGIRGTEELERLVNAGAGVCAFSMFPTGVEDLLAVADAGGIMPPKSTWFEPKLRDGLFCHLI
jgi:uncharacterized protein (DUF1015 family)